MMYLKIRYPTYILLSVFLALTACSDNGVSHKYSFSNENNYGLLVLSLTHTTHDFKIFYREHGLENIGEISSDDRRVDFQNPRGRLIVIKLPAGLYKFYNYRYSGDQNSKSSGDIDLPFRIHGGKAVYIGNIFLKTGTSTGKSNVLVLNNSERDLKLFYSRYKNINESQVLNLFDIKESDLPLFK